MGVRVDARLDNALCRPSSWSRGGWRSSLMTKHDYTSPSESGLMDGGAWARVRSRNQKK